MAKVTESEVTFCFTGKDIEGYVARMALSLLLHDPTAFSPEEAQRINTMLDMIDERYSEDDNAEMAKALQDDADEFGISGHPQEANEADGS